MVSQRAIVVLAAGVGSRFGGMKQVADVSPGGHALMDYAVYDALRAGFEQVVLVVSDQSEPAVRAHAEEGFGRIVSVDFARQDAADRRKPWGTGHAILSARPFVDGAFGVVNADDFYGRRSFAVLSHGLSDPGPAHVLVAYTLRDTLSAFGGVSRGLCLVDDGWLKSIVELHDVRREDGGFTSRETGAGELRGDEPISTNLWGFRTGFFDLLDERFAAFRAGPGSSGDAEFLIGEAVNAAIEHGPGVRVLRTPEPFFGVTFQEDVPSTRDRLTALVEVGEYPERLWD